MEGIWAEITLVLDPANIESYTSTLSEENAVHTKKISLLSLSSVQIEITAWT